jgi:GntR family transcriptional repressor for pyruvate dehydrogenase complex
VAGDVSAGDTTSHRSIRFSRAELIAQAIESELREREVALGARIGTRAELRARFAVAPATVSEALRILETRGLITTRPGPGGGIFAARAPQQVLLRDALLEFETGEAPYADCLIVRNALEPLVCRQAARHCTPDDAADLRSIVARMTAAGGDPQALLLLGWQLHRRVAGVCRNVPLRSLYLTLLDFVESGLREVHAADSQVYGRDLEIHAELAEAIVAGEPERLERAIARHTPRVDELIEPPAA